MPLFLTIRFNRYLAVWSAAILLLGLPYPMTADTVLAESGKEISAGQGHWRTYDVTDDPNGL